MFYIYVLRGADGHQYVGYTSDLGRRLREHQNRENKSTAYQSWGLIYYEAYQTEALARERERKLKHHGKVYQLLIKRLSSN